MKRPIIWATLTMAVAITVIVLGCKDKAVTTKPQVRKLTAAVYASGTLLPEQEYKVMAGVDGYLQEAYVKEGDTVHKGQQLFYISNEVRHAQEQGAHAVVQRTISTVNENAPQFKEMAGRIEVARIKKEQDELQYDRYKKLFDEDAISKSSYEKYYLQYQSSLKEYQNLKQQYEQLTLAGKLQLQQAQNQLQVNRAQQNEGRIKSFVDGIVYDIYKETGDLVSPNQPVALIGSGDMIAKLLIDEDDLEKVYVGQEVLITMDAYDNKVFKAHISKVYPMLNKVEQSFRVDATFDETLPLGIYGLNLEANIVLARDKEVLVIPRSALQKGDSVLIKDGDGKKAVHVATGIADDEWIEVKSGVDTTSIIILK
ncbi:MAG: efflux RND transporter periplasmic adaptor subunit [Chitinophagaceae bacterium]|nr:efflux RND transporter periplasmic adaptor subunit [Chitinophagaceae bacterium]MCB9047161.1 efflux RND transporter periplasmic adaptor subunit [Chitinophagales bacterium]